MEEKDDERGRHATFDRRSGAVHGSGSGAGGGNPGEDYDDDTAAGGGPKPSDGAGRADLADRGTGHRRQVKPS